MADAPERLSDAREAKPRRWLGWAYVLAFAVGPWWLWFMDTAACRLYGWQFVLWALVVGLGARSRAMRGVQFTRWQKGALCALLLAVSTLVGLRLGQWYCREPRYPLIEMQVESRARGRVILAAIYSYQRAHGRFPRDLGDVFPEHPEVRRLSGLLGRANGGYLYSSEESWHYSPIDFPDGRSGFSLSCRRPGLAEHRGAFIWYCHDVDGKRYWRFPDPGFVEER